jgi:uncharacterized membrane protein YjjB (DUF3815 family)
VVLGIELTSPPLFLQESVAGGSRLNLAADMVLAGVATCGFAAFYNTAWRQLGMAIAGGMAGHGVRYIALKAGCWPEAATFLGGFTVGVVAACIVRASKAPLAVIGFAGAVTMIPGLSFYRALGGALQLARQVDMTDAEEVTRTLGHGLQGCLVMTALALGLILGARIVFALVGRRDVRVHTRVDRGRSGRPASESAGDPVHAGAVAEETSVHHGVRGRA